MIFDGQVICAVPDGVGNDTCLWPFPDVTVYANGMLGQVNLAEAVEQAVAGWNKVCGINLALTPNEKTANIFVTLGSIDGSGKTLAWSELPCGFAQRSKNWNQLRQKYDTGEMWTISENPPGGRIDAVRVICHELGHAIGISHIVDGNLMAPRYSDAIRWPQRGDALEAISRYGKVVVATDPVPVPTIPGTPPPSAGASDWASIVLRLLKVGADFLDAMTPEDRRALLAVIKSAWKLFTPEVKAKLEKLISE